MSKRQRDGTAEELKTYIDNLVVKGFVGDPSLLLMYDPYNSKINFEDVFWDVFCYLDFFQPIGLENVGEFLGRAQKALNDDNFTKEEIEMFLNAFKVYQEYLEELHDIRIGRENKARKTMEEKMTSCK
jgi:hypothetical protein